MSRRHKRPAPAWHEDSMPEAHFHAIDPTQPPHVHVCSGAGVAKVWLIPIRVAWARGLNPYALRVIETRVTHYTVELLKRWEQHCGEGDQREARG